MENNNSQLQTTVTTPVTNTITDVSVPTDLAETNLTELQNTFNQAGSNFNLMGEALAKDVNARQQLLIGNNFGPTSGSAVGDLNYDTYYEQGLAQGANAIRQQGTKIALSEGMRRAQDKAKKRAEKAQKDYNDRVAAANARAAAAAAAAAQSSAPSQATNKGAVQGVQISADKLKKYGVSSAADLAKTDPAAFEREMKLAADDAVGVNNANVWKHESPTWYAAVDKIYQQFGANSEQRKDERTGSQTKASKEFWSRKDVGDAFSQLMVSNAGYSNTYYQDRNNWVSNVNTKVQELIKKGGTIDQINQTLEQTRLTVNMRNDGNKNANQTAMDVKHLFADPMKLAGIMGKLNDTEKGQLKQIQADVQEALSAAKEAGGDADAAISSVLREKGYAQGATGMYNQAVELISKSGVNIAPRAGLLNPQPDPNAPFAKNNKSSTALQKREVDKATASITLDGSTAVREVLGLTAEDIQGLHRWKTQDEGDFNRNMNIALQIQTMPVSISDGSLVDSDGKQIAAGTAVIYSYGGSENLESYKRLEGLLEQKPVIYDDGTGSYGWMDVDDVNEYYAAYTKDVSRMVQNNMAYFGTAEAGTGKGASFIIARNKQGGGSPSADKDSENETLKYSLGNVPIRDYKTNDDIKTRFEKLTGNQKREFYESLVKRSGYNQQGEQKALDGEPKFHNVVDEDISVPEAQDLLMIMHYEMSQTDSDGKPTGIFRPVDLSGSRVETTYAGAATAAQQSINFVSGAAVGLFGVPADLINKLNGNAAKDGYKSAAERGYEIAQGGDGKGVVKFADGYIADMYDVREQENMAIFSGFGDYYKQYDNFTAVGEMAEFIGSFMIMPAPFKAIKAVSNVVNKGVVKSGSASIKAAIDGAEEAASAATKGLTVLRYETKAGAGTANGVNLGSHTLDIVDTLLPKSASSAGRITNEAIDSSVSISSRTVDIAGAAKSAMLSLRESNPEIFFKSAKLDPSQELMFKNAARAQLTAAGATEVAYDSSSRMVRAVAAAMYNGGSVASRKAAANLINHAHNVAESGRRFTTSDAFKFAAQHVEAGSTKGLRLLNLLAQESKWTAGYIGWDFATEVGTEQHGKYAAYLDESGNFSWAKAAEYQGSNLLGDVVAGTLGYGLLGPGMRAIQNSRYNRKLDKWSHIRDSAQEGSKLHLKAMQKVGKYSQAANKFANESAAKFITEGNTTRFRELSARSSEEAANTIRAVTSTLDVPLAEGVKRANLTLDEAMSALDGKISYNTMYSKTIASIKVTAKDRLNILKSDLPTLSALDEKQSVRMMAQIYRNIEQLPKGATREQYLQAELKAMTDFGIPEQEARRFRRAYDDDAKRMASEVEAGNLSLPAGQKELRTRAVYHSPAGLFSPAHANIPIQYAGIDISAGITSATKATMSRDAIDMAQVFYDLERRVNNQVSNKAKGAAIETGSKAALDEVNVKMANPVLGLHAYRNKLESDIAVGRMRNARFKRWDVTKVVDDADYDLMFGVDTKLQSALNRAARRSKEYEDFKQALVARLTFDSTKSGSKNLTPEATGRQAEAFIENIVGGVVGPSEIAFMKSMAKDAKAVDNFLRDYTALHVGIAEYERVYKQMSRDRALEKFEIISGREATAKELKDLDAAVAHHWSVEAGYKADDIVSKSDAPINASEIAKDSSASQYMSPARIFQSLEEARDEYLTTTTKYTDILPEYDNIRFNEKNLNQIDMMDSSELIGKEYRLLDLTDNPERISTILATAPKDLAGKIEKSLSNAKVVFKSGGGGSNGKTIFQDVRLDSEANLVIEIYPKQIRKDGGSIRATLGHESVHLYDSLDFDKFGYDYMTREGRKTYKLNEAEARGRAYSNLEHTESRFNRVLSMYDDMLKHQSNAIPDMVKAADKANVKLDLKRAIDEYGTKNIDPVRTTPDGITYIRRSDFEKSELSARYEPLRGGVAKGPKNDSEIVKSTADAIENSVRAMEKSDGIRPGELYVDREYADMIRTYDREGGEAFKRDGILSKIGEVSNEIQQLQLAAGYSIFNAYTARQFVSAVGAKIFSDPKGVVELFKTYGRASSVESMRKYLANPETAEFLTQMSLSSGDTTILDAIMDSVATQSTARNGVLEDITRRMQANMAQAAVDGKRVSAASRGVIDGVHRMVDDPTFKRFLPALMLETMHSTYKRKVAKLGRTLDPNVFPGDKALLDNIMKETYEEWDMFWGLNIGTRKKSGGIAKFNQDKQAKFLSGQARGTTFSKIANGIFFALRYRMTQFSRFANGLVSLNPATFKDPRYASSRSLLMSGLAIVAAAQVWNYSQTGENTFTDVAAGISANDPNDLYRLLTDFGAMGRFNIGDSGLQVDPFFSVFTLQNSVAREAFALRNTFTPPDRRIEGVQGLGQELSSLLLSPLRTVYDLVGGTYYGYSVWGEGASAIDPETDEPIPYSPLDNAIAISAHVLGLDTFGFGANLTYQGMPGGTEMRAGRNARGEFIGGGGLVQHEYISAVQNFLDGDLFGAFSTALELPLRANNEGGRAKASLNGWVMDSIRSYKHEYDDAVKGGNLSKEDKEAKYREFAEKAINIIGVWNRRHNILEDRPEQMQAAQRIAMGFLADEWSDSEKRIVTAYRAAGIDALGGFDKKPDESDQEYEERSQRVSDAYAAQMDKEYAARRVLESIGFKVDGYDFVDQKTKQYKDRDQVNFQFKKLTEEGIGGQPALKDIYKDYNSRITELRNAGNRKGAAELEAEYISKYDAIVAPYVEKYGEGILLRNYDFTEMASKYAIIPTADYRRYSSQNGKKYWLQDRYGVGYKNGESLISDSKYIDAYQRLIRETLQGNSAMAITKAEDMLKGVAQGRYTVTDKQYNQLVQLFSKLRQNVK